MSKLAELQLLGMPKLTYMQAVDFIKEFWHYDFKGYIKERRKHREVIVPIQQIQYLLNIYCRLSFPRIGRIFQRDHTTVLSNVRKTAMDEDFVDTTHKMVIQFIKDRGIKC